MEVTNEQKASLCTAEQHGQQRYRRHCEAHQHGQDGHQRGFHALNPSNASSP